MFLIPRYWNVEGTLTGTASVRFFYNPSELSGAETARNNALAALQASNPNTFAVANPNAEWFKSVGTPFDGAYIAQIQGNKFPSTVQKFTPTYGTQNGVSYVELSGITSFSGGTGGFSFGPDNGSGGNSLDLVWGEVKATATEHGNKIEWTTYDERNTDYFNIEYSTDNLNFTEVQTRIPAKGFYSGESKYATYHSFSAKEVIYRVKQYDKDGTFTHSKKVSLASSGIIAKNEFKLQILANPIQGDRLKIRVEGYQIGSNAKITLYNLMGQEIKSVQTDLTENTGDIAVDCSGLSAGTYLMKYSDGINQFTDKVIK
jgi:hypothetical protein